PERPHSGKRHPASAVKDKTVFKRQKPASVMVWLASPPVVENSAYLHSREGKD
ncbi:Hypothetical protein FKW44_022577, partial [Caligus rogercresseyi]